MKLDQSLYNHIINVTRQAAIASFSLKGKHQEKQADQLAVNAMRAQLDKLPINGRIVIGEGERDKAPMLYRGEQLGNGTLELDIAVDPLEGTTILAQAKAGALAVIALAEKNCLLNAPDVYMDKIACSFNFDEQLIDLDNSLKENLTNLALAKKCNIDDLTITILDRPRHQELIAKTLELGARVNLISDGDIAAVINTSFLSNNRTDLYMGIGGAPEGVLAAAALQALGGQMAAKLLVTDNSYQAKAQYYLDDLAHGNIIFAATGVTNGDLLNGVKITEQFIETETLLLHSKTKICQKLINYQLQ